jgi:hypothetical protein
MTGCVIHYQYQAKIIEIRLRKSDDRAEVWNRIGTVIEGSGYNLSSSSEISIDRRSYSRPLRFLSPPSTIRVESDEKSNVLRVTKIRVGQTKGVSSWDIDSRVNELRDKLAEALPGLAIKIVTIRAEGQTDLFPL